jgi:hypothetical protein
MARLKHNENTTFKSNVRLMDETQITEAIKWVKVSKNCLVMSKISVEWKEFLFDGTSPNDKWNLKFGFVAWFDDLKKKNDSTVFVGN